MILGVLVLVSGFYATHSWACKNWAGTCTNVGGASGTGCRIPSGASNTSCWIYISSTCYKFVNSAAQDIFIPTNTAGEFNAFVAHLPAGVTQVGAQTLGTNCLPSCYPSTCASVTPG